MLLLVKLIIESVRKVKAYENPSILKKELPLEEFLIKIANEKKKYSSIFKRT